jgi:hypothetical protein
VNVPLPARPSTWSSRLVQLATVIVVAAVAAGTFVLSYAGVHAIALQSGVSTSLARYYPGVFDAVLVIACAAAPLQNARWWTRLYTWLVILVVVGLLGAMDAVHAMNVSLPRRELAGTVAVLPWVLVLLAFTLWLVILRHFRVQQSSDNVPVTPVTPSAEAHNVPAAAPGGRPALAALPATPGFADESPSQEPEPGPGPDEEDLVPGLRAEGSPEESPEGEAPPEESPEGEAPPDESAEGEAPAEEEASGDEAQPEAEASPEANYWDDGDRGDDEGAPDEVTEVGGVPYVTGPRLRRIRSLPATPVDDE